ncbi:hypothetical protein BVZ57_01085B, partial [Haemophilus influenzae]
RLIQAIGR